MYTQEQIKELIDRSSKFDSHALEKLGIACLTGQEGIEQDRKLAQKCLRAAVFEGNVYATDALSSFYFTEKHPGAALFGMMYCRMGAESGVINCMLKMGKLYLEGIGAIEANPILAFEWYTKAAQSGSVSAMAQLGSMYYQGIGTEVDYDKATIWTENAAKKGDVLSMYNLGILYDQKWYDDANAGYWFNEAASRGNQDAQRALKKFKYSSFSKKWKRIE